MFGVGSSSSITEIAVVFAACAYIASLLRDWRPIKALREENRGLRADLDDANKRIHELEQELAHWKGRTDLSILQTEHERITKALEHQADVLDRVAAGFNQLDTSVKAQTAAVELLAKQRLIRDAITDPKEQP